MNSIEPERYFRNLGKVLRGQPERVERKKFVESLSGTPEYEQAFDSLRLRSDLRRLGIDTTKFPIQTPESIIPEIAGGPVDTRHIGETSYGAPVKEFKVGEITHRIIPIRIRNADEDMMSGTMASVNWESKGMVINHFPFYSPRSR